MDKKTELQEAKDERLMYKELWHKESRENIELKDINKFLREVLLNLSRSLKLK